MSVCVTVRWIPSLRNKIKSVPLSLKFDIKILATMNTMKQDKLSLFAEVNLTGDEFRHSPSTHSLKLVRWKVRTLSVGSLMSLIMSKGPRMKTCTDCFPNFGKTLTESTNIFIDTGEHLADGNIHHKAKGHRLIVWRGSPNSYNSPRKSWSNLRTRIARIERIK